jgi:hypothetical protein
MLRQTNKHIAQTDISNPKSDSAIPNLKSKIQQLVRIQDPGYLVILLIFLVLLPLSTPRIYATDEVQYYAYVRSLYFDHDMDFANEYQHFAEAGMQNDDPAVYNALLRHRDDDPPRNPQTGKYRNLAPIGASIMWSPGFVLTDIGVRLARLAGADIAADGYSRPYIWSVCFMSALYALLGLLLTYRLARRFAAIFPAALATITVWLASPLVFYTYIAMPWSHATAFFLFALFLTLWLRGWDGPLAERQAERPLWNWALLGLVGGLMASTREQLGLFMLLPAVEGGIAYINHARNSGGIRASLSLFRGHLIFLVCLGLALLPQFLTYQILNGRPFPSTVVSGKLSSSGGISPHFFDTLFHPQHGAFLWSPVLLIGLFGLVWIARRDCLLAWLLLLGFLVQTYINGSFGTTWHLSGSFGFRRLIECTPIFIIGLAALLDRVVLRTGPIPLLIAAAALIYWNVGLIAQWTIVRTEMRKGLIWNDMLTYQFVKVPERVVSLFSDLLFNRCRLYKNTTCFYE